MSNHKKRTTKVFLAGFLGSSVLFLIYFSVESRELSTGIYERKEVRKMLKVKPFANALAITMTVVYIICRVLVAVAPGLLRLLAQSWIHTYDLSAIPAGSTTFGGFLGGLITAVIASWLFGYLLAWTYNKLSKKT